MSIVASFRLSEVVKEGSSRGREMNFPETVEAKMYEVQAESTQV